MRLEKADWMEWPQTKTLLEAFASAKAELRFVGGCVRDSLLGRSVQDVDAATPEKPEAVLQLLVAAGIRAIPTGIDHGTVTAAIGGKNFEITTLRRDTACDGRHAVVEYTTDWKADAARRDFTINAFYVDASGEIYDYFGGLAHLKPVQVVFIGEAKDRIDEDALRILRFFRFMAQLGVNEPDAAGLAACAQKSRLILGLSGERIAQEMLKLLAVPVLEPWLLAGMHKAKVLEELHLPAPPALLVRFHEPDALSRLALWLLSASDGERLAATLRDQWRLSTAQHRTLLELMRAAIVLQHTHSQQSQKKLLREAGKSIFVRAARMAAAMQPEAKSVYDAALVLAESWAAPAFPLTGQDLLLRGYREGRELGDQLKFLEKQWEEEDYQPTREELLNRLPKESGA